MRKDEFTPGPVDLRVMPSSVLSTSETSIDGRGCLDLGEISFDRSGKASASSDMEGR